MFNNFLEFIFFFKDKFKYFVGYSFQYLLSIIFSIVLIPRLAINIGFSEFGQIGKLLSISGLAIVIINYSFSVTSVPKVSLQNNNIEKFNIFKKITVSKFLLSIVAIFILYSIYYFFDYIAYSSFIILSIYFITVSINSMWFLQATEKFNLIIISGIFSNLLSFIVYFSLKDTEYFFSVDNILIFIILPQILNNFFTYLMANYKQKSSYTFSLLAVYELIYSEFSVFISQLVSSIYVLTGPLFLIYLSSSYEAGIFSIVDRINFLILGGLLMIFSIYMPKLSVLFNTKKAKYYYSLKQIFLFYLSIISIIFIIFQLFKPSFLNLLFKSDLLKFSHLIYLSLFYVLIGSLGPLVTYHLVLSNKKKYILLLTSFILITTISSSFFLTNKFGSIGWLLSSIIGQSILVFTVIFLYLKKKK